MIVGLGTDIVEISRIEAAMRRPQFVRRILTAREREFSVTPAQVAGRWAAKEAIYKALGIPKITWQEVEILPDEMGVPSAQIESSHYDPARLRIRVSIAHERHYATAIAIVERLVYQAPHP